MIQKAIKKHARGMRWLIVLQGPCFTMPLSLPNGCYSNRKKEVDFGSRRGWQISFGEYWPSVLFNLSSIWGCCDAEYCILIWDAIHGAALATAESPVYRQINFRMWAVNDMYIASDSGRHLGFASSLFNGSSQGCVVRSGVLKKYQRTWSHEL